MSEKTARLRLIRVRSLHIEDASGPMTDQFPNWADDLRTKLTEAADRYRNCIASHQGRPGSFELRDRIDPDAEPIDIARIYILKSLGAVMEALLGLPEFGDDGGLVMQPLYDLAQALRGLNEGRRSDLLETRKVAEQTRHPVVAQRQALATALVEFFERAGLSNINARKEVARILGKAGFAGRKGRPISAQTLYEWQTQIEGEEPNSPRRLILAEYRAVLFPTESYSPSIEEARLLTHSMTMSVLFHSLI